MRALITDESGIDQLRIAEVPAPVQPGPGQVVVRPRAFSLNFRDLMIAEGRYGKRAEMPHVAGSDMAGEVEAVGEGVTDLKPGDRVLNAPITGWIAGTFETPYHATFLGSGEVPGVFAERVVLPAQALVKFSKLSFQEAATVTIAGLTAWAAVVTHGKLRPGGRVLCLGTGGVSIYAAQIARAMNAQVYITSSSDEKLERCAALLGAPLYTINYKRTPDFQKEVMRLTDRAGVDVVVETVGGESLQRSIESVRPGGRVCSIGLLGSGESRISIPHLLSRQVQLIGIYMESIAELRQFVQFLESASIKPVVDRVFPFDQARDAYAYLKSQGHFGKIVIEM